MATTARDRLARMLRGDAQTAFSVELTAAADDLRLEVEGFGRVKLPVTPAKARKLLGLGQPARFGRGEETLTDPEVRDTWEIATGLVRAAWDDATLKDVLATVKEELGLPHGTVLTADLHSLLVYEPDQFFLAHQDSEKDDSMIGTLVVTRRVSLLREHRGQRWYGRDYDDVDSSAASANEGDYDIHGLVDFEVALTHWTGPEGTLTETSLRVDPRAVCASTPTDGLAPYSCAYEGYMGNWGNTLDRWYHRAAVIVWPREQAFANRAEASPARALDELAAMASAGDVPGARAATTLLHPFHVEDLGGKTVNSFGKIAGKYGQPWTAELLRAWFGGNRSARACGGGRERPQWVADQLPGLCARLHADGPAGVMAAQQLVDLAWEWIAQEARIGGAKDLEWLVAQWNAGARAK